MDEIGNYITIKTSTVKKPVGYLNITAIQKEYIGAYLYHHRILSEGIGLSFLEYGCTYPNDKFYLIYAKVNGLEYTAIKNIINDQSSIHQKFQLFSNYPNPFNSATYISFVIEHDCFVLIEIFNSIGIRKTVLLNRRLAKGRYRIKWDASDYESGLYLIRSVSGDFYQIQKCLLLK